MDANTVFIYSDVCICVARKDTGDECVYAKQTLYDLSAGLHYKDATLNECRQTEWFPV